MRLVIPMATLVVVLCPLAAPAQTRPAPQKMSAATGNKVAQVGKEYKLNPVLQTTPGQKAVAQKVGSYTLIPTPQNKLTQSTPGSDVKKYGAQPKAAEYVVEYSCPTPTLKVVPGDQGAALNYAAGLRKLGFQIRTYLEPKNVYYYTLSPQTRAFASEAEARNFVNQLPGAGVVATVKSR